MVSRPLTSMRKLAGKSADLSRAPRLPRSRLLPPQNTVTRKTGATWSGQGRAPGWIATAKDRSKFAVEGMATSSAPAAKKSAKAGNYVRGPQPALYRDPKTGATWSGRGRAPSWISGAKDRSRFLIGGAAAADRKPVIKKVASRKALTANKASAKTAPSRKETAPERRPALKLH